MKLRGKFIKKDVFIIFLLLISATINAQVINGTVSDSNGNPIDGAIIYIVDTGEGSVTNPKGEFSILAEKGQTLEISHSGMKTKEVVINQDKLKIILDYFSEELEDLVVTGYNKVKSRVFVGATSSVKMEDIKIEGISDVSKILEGRVAGLNIQNVNNTFGAAPRINIRGGASISANIQPLWVIDGSVYEDIVSLTLDQLVSGDAITLISSAIAGINANDIEDIQVLKDASATSMYGARALNGVIVITTKSGKRNSKNKISYYTDYSFRQAPSYTNFNLLNSQQTMAIYQEMYRKGYFDEASSMYGRRAGIYHIMYQLINTYNPQSDSFLLENTEAAKLQFLKKAEYANTDWFKSLFGLRPMQNHAITYSGGGKNTANYSSISFLNDAGWSIADKLSRFTINLKNTYFITDKLSTKFSLQGNIRNQTAPGTFSRKENKSTGVFERDFDINPFVYALNTTRTLAPRDENGNLVYYRNNWANFNILNEYENNYIKVNLLDFKAQGELDYKITPELKTKGLLSFRRASTTNSHYILENSNVIKAFRANENSIVANENIYLVKNPNNPLLDPKVGLTHGGIFNKTENTLQSFLGRLSVDYDTYIGENHDVKLFGFSEIRSADRTINPFQGYGIQFNRGNQIFTNPDIFDKLILEGLNYFELNSLHTRGVTFSGNATYGYAGKYIINAVANYEGSNISGRGTKSRWLPTWNIGAKWNVNKEDFLIKSDIISNLALRINYGLTAKMNERAINSVAVYNSLITNRLAFEDRESLINILHLENRDLTWEKMYEMNIGLDFGFLKNNVNLSLDAYQRNSFDLIDLVRTSGIGGQYYKYANFGDMRTRGIELTLSTNNVKTNKFSWQTTLVGSFYNQEITHLRNAASTFDLVSGTGKGNVVGYPRGSLFSFQFNGLNENGLPTFDFKDYPFENIPYPNIAGANFSDTKYTTKYLKYEGPIEPNFTAGLSNTFRYDNIEFSFFITSQAGNKIRLQPTFDPQFADLNVFSKDYYDRWLVSGDEYTTNVPVIPSKDLIETVGQENINRAYNTYNYSNLKVADGSFIRMKNIAIGYNIPKRLTKKIGVESLNIKVQTTNVFLIYSDKKLRGQDPEFYRTGGVSTPITRQYTLSFNINF